MLEAEAAPPLLALSKVPQRMPSASRKKQLAALDQACGWRGGGGGFHFSYGSHRILCELLGSLSPKG